MNIHYCHPPPNHMPPIIFGHVEPHPLFLTFSTTHRTSSPHSHILRIIPSIFIFVLYFGYIQIFEILDPRTPPPHLATHSTTKIKTHNTKPYAIKIQNAKNSSFSPPLPLVDPLLCLFALENSRLLIY